jgi:hypothetical protein
MISTQVKKLRVPQMMRRASILLCLPVLTTVALSSPAYAASDMPASFHAWNGSGFFHGSFNGSHVIYQDGAAQLTLPAGSTTGTWTSDTFATPMPVNKIVTLWQASTPQDSYIETHLQVELQDNTWSNWYDMGHWSFKSSVDSGGAFVSQRGSVDNQADTAGAVYQDTYFANDNTWAKAYRVQEVLHGNPSGSQPTVRQVAATAADTSKNLDENGGVSPVSSTTMHHTIDLNVPEYSQYAHNGEYTQIDGGGPAWCSPSSVSMVLGYFGRGPSRQQIQSLPADATFDANHRADGAVDYAAFHIFDNTDSAKDTGDWPFNMGYAASFGMNTSVRQYNSLQGVESWIKQGVPIVATIKWDNTSTDATQHLDGSSISKTAGHLMVIRGFTKNGDVIANDPASPNDASVKHVYDRAQFEHLWLRAASGTVYVIQAR